MRKCITNCYLVYFDTAEYQAVRIKTCETGTNWFQWFVSPQLLDDGDFKENTTSDV